VKRRRQKLPIVIEIYAAENCVSAQPEGGKGLRYPIRRNLTVGVGRQDHPCRVALFQEPSFGQVHRRAASSASVSRRRRQLLFNDADVEG
jgi:hypothetical protein